MLELLKYLIKYNEETHPAELYEVLIYRERAFAHCGGCDSRLQFPFVCVHIFPVASYLPPSESAVRGGKEGTEGGKKREIRIEKLFHLCCELRI